MTLNVMIALCTIIFLFALVLGGVHIAFSLTAMSFVGILLVTGNLATALSIISTTSFNAIRTYTYCVAPLFMMMGTIMAFSGSAGDLFDAAQRALKKMPGGLAAATIVGNAIFAAVTGVSIASATVFSQVAVPQMEKYKYEPNFAAGVVGGSSVLGMIIPPSLFFIVYGTVAEVSIGKLFVAGVIPGILMALIFIAAIVVQGWRKPYLIGLDEHHKPLINTSDVTDGRSGLLVFLKAAPILLLVVLVLGGIWGGWCTPTEAAGIGCAGALIIALCKRTMKFKQFTGMLTDVSRSSAGILLLLITAQMYSRLLSVSGMVTWVSKAILSLQVPSWIIIIIFLGLVLLLGCILDGSSIILLTTPIMQPVIMGLDMDPVWWGVILVLAVCIGMLTPPFGMIVFAMKGVLGDRVELMQLFKCCTPYIFYMILTIILCTIFPSLVTWLPNMMGS